MLTPAIDASVARLRAALAPERHSDRSMIVGAVLASRVVVAGCPSRLPTSADQQLAEAGVLVLSDFPSGWK